MAEREYIAAKKKRDKEKAKKVKEAEKEKAKIVADQEQKKKENITTEYGLIDGGNNAEYNKKIKEADEKIKKAGELTPFEKGTEKAIQVLGEEGLGRLGERKDIQEVISETRDFRKTAEMGTGLAKEQLDRAKGLSSRYEQMADQGMDPEAREAMRTKMGQDMAQASQLAGLRLGAALGGARGASSAAQSRSLMGQAIQGRANIERDIFLANEQAKLKGLQGLGASLAGERGALAGVQQGVAGERAALGDFASRVGQVGSFDIGQAAAEKELIGRLGLSFEQMKSQERAAALAAEAQMKSGGGGKK